MAIPLKKEKKENINIQRSISNIWFMLRIVMRHTPGYLTLICLYAAYCAAEVFLEFTYATKYLLELIENGGIGGVPLHSHSNRIRG